MGAFVCRFAAGHASVVHQFNSVDAFGQFLSAAQRISEQHESMHAADIASMYIALVKFVGAVYPDQLDSVDRVLQSCCTVRHHSPAGGQAKGYYVSCFSYKGPLAGVE